MYIFKQQLNNKIQIGKMYFMIFYDIKVSTSPFLKSLQFILYLQNINDVIFYFTNYSGK